MFVLTLLFLTMVVAGKDSKRSHPDYVADEKTALRIAEAVLIGQFGEERVKAQSPLIVDPRFKDVWLVQGLFRDEEHKYTTGGNFGIWIDKHEGCVKVMEHMK